MTRDVSWNSSGLTWPDLKHREKFRWENTGYPSPPGNDWAWVCANDLWQA